MESLKNRLDESFVGEDVKKPTKEQDDYLIILSLSDKYKTVKSKYFKKDGTRLVKTIDNDKGLEDVFELTPKGEKKHTNYRFD